MYYLSDEDPAPKAPAKKNKKRWCGGHEGREHTPVITMSKFVGNWQCGYRTYTWRNKGLHYVCWHEVTCAKCHKTLKHKSDSCPDMREAEARYLKENR